MADAHLGHARHGLQELGEVVAVEVVPGVHTQPGLQRGLCRGRVGGQAVGELRCAVRLRVHPCIALGVKLHAVRTHFACVDHGLGQRIHEQAHPHAQGMTLLDERAQALAVGGQVPPMVTRELVNRVGHEGGLVRPSGPHDIHEVVERVALDVELGLRPTLHQGGNFIDIPRADVPLIRARVNGDALAAGLQAALGCAHHAGNVQVARIAQQRHLVDVHRQGGGGVPMCCAAVQHQGVHGVAPVGVRTPKRRRDCMSSRVRSAAPPRWCAKARRSRVRRATRGA